METNLQRKSILSSRNERKNAGICEYFRGKVFGASLHDLAFVHFLLKEGREILRNLEMQGAISYIRNGFQPV